MIKKIMFVGIVLALIGSCFSLPTVKAQDSGLLGSLFDVAINVIAQKGNNDYDYHRIIAEPDKHRVVITNSSDIELSVYVDGNIQVFYLSNRGKIVGQTTKLKKGTVISIDLSVPWSEGRSRTHTILVKGERNGEIVTTERTFSSYKGMGQYSEMLTVKKDYLY